MRPSCLHTIPAATSFSGEVLTRMYRPGADRVYQIGGDQEGVVGTTGKAGRAGTMCLRQRCRTVSVHTK